LVYAADFLRNWQVAARRRQILEKVKNLDAAIEVLSLLFLARLAVLYNRGGNLLGTKKPAFAGWK
jgi:hypothetical protein